MLVRGQNTWTGKFPDLVRHHDVDIMVQSAHTYRVIKKTYPPSRAEMKNPPEKLSIAFSNTTYLNIIWRFLSTTMYYLCFYDSYCKMNHVSIFGVLLKSYFCRLRDRSKFTGYLGRVLGKICLKNSVRPPFFSRKKVFAPLIFSEKKSLPPFFS